MEDNETELSLENEDSDDEEIKVLEKSVMDIKILEQDGKKKTRDEQMYNDKQKETWKNEHQDKKNTANKKKQSQMQQLFWSQKTSRMRSLRRKQKV